MTAQHPRPSDHQFGVAQMETAVVHKSDPSETPEYRVTMEIRAVQGGISELWRMRMDPKYADEILKAEGDLYAALGTLRTLVEDIRASNDTSERYFVAAE